LVIWLSTAGSGTTRPGTYAAARTPVRAISSQSHRLAASSANGAQAITSYHGRLYVAVSSQARPSAAAARIATPVGSSQPLDPAGLPTERVALAAPFAPAAVPTAAGSECASNSVTRANASHARTVMTLRARRSSSTASSGATSSRQGEANETNRDAVPAWPNACRPVQA